MIDTYGKRPWIIGSIASVVVVLVLSLFLGKGGRTSAQEEPTPTPVPTSTPTATAIPTVTPVPTPIEPGQHVHKLFSELHDQVAGIPPHDARQQQLVERYQYIKNLALRTGVPIQFLEESKRFAREQAFLAAKAAWEDALWHGQVTRADQQAVTYYATLLRNAGRNFAVHGATEDLQANGQSLLVACQQIVQKHRLPLAECEADVRELLGDKPQPPPAPSPLL